MTCCAQAVHAAGVSPPAQPADPRLALLVDAATAGDRRALSRLLHALGPSVLRVARGVLGRDHPDVEDAAQDSLLAVASALPSFRGECTFVHFACRIAARRCVAARRRASERVARRERLVRESIPVAAPVKSPGAVHREALRALLSTLPEEQAETLVLRIVMGFSLAEVADATGVPVNTVRSRVRLSKEALRKRIASDPELAEALEVPS